MVREGHALRYVRSDSQEALRSSDCGACPLDVLSKCWENIAALQLLAPIGVLTVDYGLARPAGAPEPPIVTPFGQRFLAFVTLPILGSEERSR